MKNRFQCVRIYEDAYGFREPYSNIEFVITDNLAKRFIDAWTPLKKDEWVSDSKYGDNRIVYRPQNYEQFLKYLSETKVDEELGDIKVYNSTVIYDEDLEVEIEYLVDLEDYGYETLLSLATEMLYINNESRSEKTENHLKRTFVNQANRIHKDMTLKYNKERGQEVKNREA